MPTASDIKELKCSEVRKYFGDGGTDTSQYTASVESTGIFFSLSVEERRKNSVVYSCESNATAFFSSTCVCSIAITPVMPSFQLS
jgi:hypothetical protein